MDAGKGQNKKGPLLPFFLFRFFKQTNKQKKSRGATTIDPNASFLFFSMFFFPTSAKLYHLNKWRERQATNSHQNFITVILFGLKTLQL